MKKQMLTILLIVVGMLISAGGCCSIMSGSMQRVAITSIPPGAKVTSENNVTIITPGVITLTRKDAHTLIAELPGYETCSLTFHRKWNGWLWADLLWDFGIISWPIDFGTGAAYTLTPESKCFRFKKSHQANLNCRSTEDYATSYGKFIKGKHYNYVRRGSTYVVDNAGEKLVFGKALFLTYFELIE